MNFKNARTDEQLRVMERAQKDGVCPFCPENIRSYHPKPILLEGKYWLVTENMSPYEGARLHFLFVYSENHVESVTEISAEAFAEIYFLLRVLIVKYQIKGGTLIFRFGDNKYSGGSVNHLHAQLIVGDADNPEHKGVRVKVG